MPRIVGLDISLVSTGIAIVDEDGLRTLRIKPDGRSDPDRLNSIYTKLQQFWKTTGRIDQVVIEESLIGKYVDVVRQVMAAHGVFLASMSAASMKAPILYVHSATLKRLVTGHGRAPKRHVIAKLKELTGRRLQNDEADATALAMLGEAYLTCHRPTDSKLSKIMTPAIDGLLLSKFGLSPEIMEAKRKAQNKVYRDRSRAKLKAERQKEKLCTTT